MTRMISAGTAPGPAAYHLLPARPPAQGRRMPRSVGVAGFQVSPTGPGIMIAAAGGRIGADLSFSL